MKMMVLKSNSRHVVTSDINLASEPYLPKESTIELKLKPDTDEWKAFMGTELNFVSILC